ncbi:MAG: GxxExxY protein [Spirochaetia bacterium]|nr:GxxExxY protein [Spirochaetota bacterium]MDW8113168.1 GxxExxY protein [Spirochaetia bacterium]
MEEQMDVKTVGSETVESGIGELQRKIMSLEEKIINLASKVYKELKPFGFIDEKEFESALAYEFRKNGLKYLEQLQVDIMYERQHVVKGGKVDFIVFDENEEIGILVELKLLSDVKDENIDQVIKYYESLRKNRNPHFPSFISDKIVKGIVLLWRKPEALLRNNFNRKSGDIPSKEIEYREFKNDIEIIEIRINRDS